MTLISKKKIFQSQTGQTLIETLAAIFILIMGLTAAVGLAIYAFNSSTNISKQIIATGLAREGIEAVKNMRDTNWLKIPGPDVNCYNYADTSSPNSQDAKCYKQWLNPPGGDNYDITPSGGNSVYLLRVDPTADESEEIWSLTQESSNRLGLDLDTNFSGLNFEGVYSHPTPPDATGTSDYYRKITLRTDGANDDAPFNQDVGPRLQIISQVWWTDKKCPRVQNWPGTGKCSVELQAFLTNWKNY